MSAKYFEDNCELMESRLSNQGWSYTCTAYIDYLANPTSKSALAAKKRESRRKENNGYRDNRI